MAMADIAIPNTFELEYLTGRTVGTLAEARTAIAALQAMGPSVVLVTSLLTTDTPDDSLDLLAADASGFWRVRTPRLNVSVNGAGDAIAALFFVHYARSRSTPEALGAAAASIYGLLKRTQDAGSREILLVAAQDEFVTPTRRFAVEQL
jgi:pyridoxine kinase